MPKWAWVAVVVGPLLVIGLATYLILRPDPPKVVIREPALPAEPQTAATKPTTKPSTSEPSLPTTQKTPAVEQQEMESLRAKIAELEAQASKRQVPASQQVTTPTTVRGAAWLNKEDGSSHLQRGLRVRVLPVMMDRAAATQVLQAQLDAWKREQGISENKVKSQRIIADIHRKSAREAKAKVEALQTAISRLPETIHTTDLYALAKREAQYQLPKFRPTAETLKLIDGSSNVDGKFSVGGIPPGDYVLHAVIDSGQFYVEWLVPFSAAGKDVEIDLHNDNAANLHRGL